MCLWWYLHFIWVKFNISLTWILRPFGDDSLNPNHDSRFGRDVRLWSNLARYMWFPRMDSLDDGLLTKKLMLNHQRCQEFTFEVSDFNHKPCFKDQIPGFFMFLKPIAGWFLPISVAIPVVGFGPQSPEIFHLLRTKWCWNMNPNICPNKITQSCR